MSQAPQGPGWWQASDLKWYPPQGRADYPASLPPSPGMQPSVYPPTRQPPPERTPGWTIVSLLLVIGVPVVLLLVFAVALLALIGQAAGHSGFSQ
jgi:hypothetical protein